MTLRRRAVGLGVLFAVLLSVSAISLVTEASAASCTIAGAGDIGQVANGPQQQTGDEVRSINPEAVFTLGDNAQVDGVPAEYTDLYDPFWGSFKSITHPVPGNHDYNTPGATGYFGYFGVQPYYAWEICGWRLYALNAELTGTAKATEVSWFTADLTAHPGVPTIAMWHQPRWSDVASNGPDPTQQDLWAAAVAGGVKVVMNGHEHAYERFGKMNASGQPAASGPRMFISGTGGARLKAFNTSGIMAASEKRISGFGILALTLRPTGYDWNWTGVDTALTDTGSDDWGTSTTTSPPSSSSTTTSTTTTPPASGPAFVAATSRSFDATGSATGSVPAGAAAGDVLVASLSLDNAPTVTGPAGWTRLSIMPLTPSGVTVDTWYRVATASEPASYTWMLSGAQKGSVGIGAYRGVGAPRAVSRVLVSGTSIGVGGLSATAGEVLVGGVGIDTGTATVTPPSGWTQAFATTGAGQVAEQAFRVGPASGTFTWTSSKSLPAGGWAMVLPALAAARPSSSTTAPPTSTTKASTTSTSTTTPCAPVTVTVTVTRTA